MCSCGGVKLHTRLFRYYVCFGQVELVYFCATFLFFTNCSQLQLEPSPIGVEGSEKELSFHGTEENLFSSPLRVPVDDEENCKSLY